MPPNSAAVAAPSLCAPARYPLRQRTGTCLLPEELNEMAVRLVRDPRKRASVLSAGAAGAKARALHAALGTRQDVAWSLMPAVRSDPVLRGALSRAFRPARPSSWARNPRQWLSSLDIDAVMRQYEESHPHFRYLGALPMDFAESDPSTHRCVSEAACHLHVESALRSGKSLIGMALNLDDHTESGSHWVACCAGIDPADPLRFGVWFYDSVARPPTPQVRAFVKRLALEVRGVLGEAASAHFRIHWNTRRKQWENTECGVYTMLFLIACVTTAQPVPKICAAMRGDAATNRLRDLLYAHAD